MIKKKKKSCQPIWLCLQKKQYLCNSGAYVPIFLHFHKFWIHVSTSTNVDGKADFAKLLHSYNMVVQSMT